MYLLSKLLIFLSMYLCAPGFFTEITKSVCCQFACWLLALQLCSNRSVFVDEQSSSGQGQSSLKGADELADSAPSTPTSLVQKMGSQTPKRNRRTRVPEKPNYPLNLWSIMKNCIGKELTKIPMPVSVPLNIQHIIIRACIACGRPWLLTQDFVPTFDLCVCFTALQMCCMLCCCTENVMNFSLFPFDFPVLWICPFNWSMTLLSFLSAFNKFF